MSTEPPLYAVPALLGCWPALAVAPAQQLSCRCRRCCQGRVAVSSSPSDAASRATVLRRPLWWERWAHAGHGLGFAAGGIPSAIVDASQTEDRSAVYVHVHLPLYLPLYLHCIQARGWIQCITAYPQTPSTVFTI